MLCPTNVVIKVANHCRHISITTLSERLPVVHTLQHCDQTLMLLQMARNAVVTKTNSVESNVSSARIYIVCHCLICYLYKIRARTCPGVLCHDEYASLAAFTAASTSSCSPCKVVARASPANNQQNEGSQNGSCNFLPVAGFFVV